MPINDDYITLTDICLDGQGVRVYAWLDGKELGHKDNPHGSGDVVYWDPFKKYGNVKKGQKVTLQVCRVDDGKVNTCNQKSHTSFDG